VEARTFGGPLCATQHFHSAGDKSPAMWCCSPRHKGNHHRLPSQQWELEHLSFHVSQTSVIAVSYPSLLSCSHALSALHGEGTCWLSRRWRRLRGGFVCSYGQMSPGRIKQLEVSVSPASQLSTSHRSSSQPKLPTTIYMGTSFDFI